jgi:hypothetical protein
VERSGCDPTICLEELKNAMKNFNQDSAPAETQPGHFPNKNQKHLTFKLTCLVRGQDCIPHNSFFMSKTRYSIVTDEDRQLGKYDRAKSLLLY